MRYIDKTDRCLEFDDFLAKYQNRLKGIDKKWDWKKIKKITSKDKQGQRIHIGGEVLISLFQSLRLQQKGLCIYCEQTIPEKNLENVQDYIYGHLEHIIKQELAKTLNSEEAKEIILEQNNISVSCNGFNCELEVLEENDAIKNFCGHFKDGNYTTMVFDENQFLHPFKVRNLEEHFAYNENEIIEVINIIPNNEKTKSEQKSVNYMINFLNLQDETLKEMRLEQYNIILEDISNGEDINDLLSDDYDIFPKFYSMLKYLFKEDLEIINR